MNRFKVLLAICSLAALALIAGCKKDEAAAGDTPATVPTNPTTARGGDKLATGQMEPGPGIGNADSRVNSQAGTGK